MILQNILRCKDTENIRNTQSYNENYIHYPKFSITEN